MRIFSLIFSAFLIKEVELFAAEAGMPQLDPTYWASQTFWLIIIFTSLYLAISKIFIPKIKRSLNDRENKIKDDLDEAKTLKDLADKKKAEYEKIVEKAKKDIQKILSENRNKLNSDIQNKKKKIEEEIELEVEKAQLEIKNLKKNSITDISKVSEEVASKIIEEISGDKLNQNSIKAAILESSKKNIGKLL